MTAFRTAATALALAAALTCTAQVRSLEKSRKDGEGTVSSLHRRNGGGITTLAPQKPEEAPADTVIVTDSPGRDGNISGEMKEVTVGNRPLQVPSVIGIDGTDLWMLTTDGIEIYMAAAGCPITAGPSEDYDIARWTRDKVLRKREQTENLLERYDRIRPYVEATFRESGVPPELGVICIVESACNSLAVSPAGAVGMWQFMEATAREYGLTVNSVTDERTDPVKATKAAARYLAALFRQTGSWNLAVAAYNCGNGRIDSCIRRAGEKREWKAIKGLLPAETAQYLPSVAAFCYIDRYRTELGLIKSQK